jgi:hypothetical protein
MFTDKELHPILLNFYDKKIEYSSIFPKLNINQNNKQYLVPYKIDNFKLYEKTDNIYQNFNKFNLNYYLLIHFNIENLNDIINFLNNIIEKNLNIDTINLITNLIFENYYNDFDDNRNIDKIINYYKQYFLIYYNIDVHYNDIFKIFRKIIDKNSTIIFNNKTIHNDIVNNILNSLN